MVKVPAVHHVVVTTRVKIPRLRRVNLQSSNGTMVVYISSERCSKLTSIPQAYTTISGSCDK